MYSDYGIWTAFIGKVVVWNVAPNHNDLLQFLFPLWVDTPTEGFNMKLYFLCKVDLKMSVVWNPITHNQISCFVYPFIHLHCIPNQLSRFCYGVEEHIRTIMKVCFCFVSRTISVVQQNIYYKKNSE